MHISLILMSLFFVCSVTGTKGNIKAKREIAHKKSSASTSQSICPSQGGGLYIFRNTVPLSQAANLCLSAGYGLANLTFSSNFVASQLMLQCGVGLAWISSFERVRSNTCVLMTGDGNIFFPSGSACQQQAHAVICQDFAAVLTDTATTTFTTCTTSTEVDTVFIVTTSTSIVVSTITSTATEKRRCTDCVVTRTVFLPGGVTTQTLVTSSTTTVTLMQKAGYVIQKSIFPTTTVAVVERPEKELVVVVRKDEAETDDGIDGVGRKTNVDCPMNVPACQGDGESNEFVVLRTYLSIERAECSCRKLGMHLANINSANINRAQKALSKCAGGSYDFPAWINSWEGDDYGRSACLALGSGGAINAQSSCSDGLPVLCQQSGGGGVSMKSNVFLEASQLQNPVYSLCSTTQSNLYIVSSQSFLAGQDPAVACGSFNMIPANVYDNTRAAAAAIFAICSTGDPAAAAAQVNSFDNLRGAACNLIDDTQAVLLVDNTNGDVAQNCFVNQRYFLCQPINQPPTPTYSTIFTGPYFFVTTTTVRTGSVSTIVRTITSTVTTGTTVLTTEVELISLSLTTITSTTTTTVRITSAMTTSSTSPTFTTTTATTTPSTTASNVVTVTVTSCPSQPVSMCPFRPKSSSSSNLVLLSDSLPFSQAQCACQQLGMRLAQLTVDSFVEAVDLEHQCLGPYQKAWIAGYLGEDGEAGGCMALFVGQKTALGSAAALPLYCDTKVPVICQML